MTIRGLPRSGPPRDFGIPNNMKAPCCANKQTTKLSLQVETTAGSLQIPKRGQGSRVGAGREAERPLGAAREELSHIN